MNRLTAAAISAFSAVHAGFNREEDSGVDSLLDLSREVNETLEIIIRSERVKLVMCGRFCYDPAYIMVREISKEGKIHYHMVLLLNGQKVQSTYYVFKDMERILNNVAGPGGSINHCDNGHRNGIMVKRDAPDPHNLEEIQRQMSYLAKKEQKSNVKGKTFFTSRIKKNK